jgi:DNA polymerase
MCAPLYRPPSVCPVAGTGQNRGVVAVVPSTTDLRKLAAAAAACEGCELYERATQTVFGSGPRRAHLLLVGEQPGDVEDREGAPFVGPAGRLLDKALADAGIERADAYVTNAVKHFRWKSTGSGKRRIHEKPAMAHVTACRPWLAAEIAAVGPQVVVALGATAASSLFGPKFRLTQHRGTRIDWPDDGPLGLQPAVQYVVATVHPSAILRAGERRDEMYDGLVSDLRLAVDDRR